LWPLAAAIEAMRTRWVGLAVGVVVGAGIALVLGIAGMPAVSVAGGAALGACLLVPAVVARIAPVVARWTAVITGTDAGTSGVQVLIGLALGAVLTGMTNLSVGLVLSAVAGIAIVAQRMRGAAVVGAVLMLVVGSIVVPASTFGQSGSPTVVPSSPIEPSSPPGVREARVVVSPRAAVVDTGFDVQRGDRVHLVASGTIQLVAGDPRSVVDAAGEPARYAGCGPSLVCGTLLASLRPTSGWQRVGTEALLDLGEGRLYLSVNDSDPADDTGSFTVIVRAGPPDLLGVVLPTPVGVSRDAVITDPAGTVAAVPSRQPEAPWTDLVLAALVTAVGAVVGALVVRATRRSHPAGSR
jgi:hypothetical protein